MAVLALVYPVAFSPRQVTPSAGTESKVAHHAAQQNGEAVATESQVGANPEVQAPHDAKKILSQFIGVYPNEQELYQYPLESPSDARYEVDFLIATIPDPIDSRLPYLFDRNLSSIQRAAEADHYVLDRFDLPWFEELRERQAAKDGGKKTSSNGNESYKPHSFEQSPGLILFHDPDPAHSYDKHHSRALVLFLIGETPTTGIHKEAMRSALDQISEFCSSHPPTGAGGVRPKLLTYARSTCETMKILGPSFSGSAEALDFALHSWRKSHFAAHFLIVSGTATAIHFIPDALPGCFSNFQLPPEVQYPHEVQHPVFASAVARDIAAINKLLRYMQLRSSSADDFSVALLTEGNTAYGSSLRNVVSSTTGGPSKSSTTQTSKPPKIPETNSTALDQSNCTSDSVLVPIVDLPFPLHISRLRSESEKARRERQQSSQQETANSNSSSSLPLPTDDDSGAAEDSIPAFSQLDISSSELMLSNLLTTIAHEQFHYVGIAATDVRDVIFLAREIREHSPSTVIFALNADLLYAHPEANANTRGMLVVTPYPLFALNQRWMSPDGRKSRIQFPDQSSEGIYNAMLHLLRKDDLLLEYGSPFESSRSGKNETVPSEFPNSERDGTVPPLWIVTVGRDGFWPVAIRTREDERGYLFRAPGQGPIPTGQTNRGIVPQFTYAVIILWSFICLAPALIFLARAAERQDKWTSAKKCARWIRFLSPGEKLFTLTGNEAKTFYLIGGTTALCVYAVTIGAYLASTMRFVDWIRQLLLPAMFLILLIGFFACLSLAREIFLHAWHPSKREVQCAPAARWQRLWLASPVLITSAACWVLASSLASRWIWLRFFGNGNGVITGFRAVNLHNGVSPLTPLFFVALATLSWAFCSIRRLHLNQEIPSIPRPPNDSFVPGSEHHKSWSFFYSDKLSFRGLRVLERKVHELLICGSFQFPRGLGLAVFFTLGLTLFWGGYLFFYRLVYVFELKSFYWLLGTMFLLVYAAVLTNVLRLFFLWRALRALLQRLDRHPMRDAFSRFHRAHRTMPRMSLATAPTPLTALGFSVAQAGQLLASAQTFRTWEERRGQNLLEKCQDIFKQAEKSYSDALKSEACGHPWRSLFNQIKAQRALNRFTRVAESALEILWGWSGSAPQESAEVVTTLNAFRLQGEEFIVSRTVHFLSYIFPQFTNLATFSLVCLFLMLLAVSSYPLQPRNAFFLFNWFVILAFVGVCVYIAVQMNRDVVLSGLNGTKPGEIHWDTEFIGRLVFFIVFPILGLLGVQFPETLGQLLRWLAPAGSGHP